MALRSCNRGARPARVLEKIFSPSLGELLRVRIWHVLFGKIWRGTAENETRRDESTANLT